MKALLDFLLSRLKERSTWTTLLALVATVTGATFAPELKEAIVSAGLGVVSLIAVLTKESD